MPRNQKDVLLFVFSISQFSSVAQSCLTLPPHGLQHARLPCTSPTPGACSNSCPSSRWCHPTISSSGEGNCNILQYSCLKNPVDRGAWWAAIHRLTKNQTQLTQLSMHACIGEGNGNPLQYFCLKNPRDRGAWWASVYRVTKSHIRLKWLSSSSSSSISSFVVPFSSCLQSFPASGSFPMNQFFPSGGQSIGVSASASVFPTNIQDWFSLGLTGWISLQSKGLSRVFSNTTVQKHQFFCAQLSL